MPESLRLALTTFTVLPVRGPERVDRRTAGRAMELAPLMGLVVGVLAAAVLYGMRVVADFRSPALLASAIAIGALALVTRGLHLDGLADVVDGLASYRDPEGTREVMKRPDVGPLGLVAVVMCLLVQATALQACVLHGRGTASLVLAVVTGRLAIALACTSVPAATPDGLGATVARTVRPLVAWAWVALVAVTFCAYATVDGDQVGSDLEQAVRTGLSLPLALGAAWVLRRHATRRVGGITGDVLGALSEVATTVSLVVLASGVWGQ